MGTVDEQQSLSFELNSVSKVKVFNFILIIIATVMLMLNNIIEILKRGLMMFVFFLLMFSIGRIVFIFALRDYISEASAIDILTALWVGLRLSCQTAGILALLILLSSIISRVAMKYVSIIVFVITSTLYVASFPFYEQFHSNFNQMIFNAVNDDMYALLITFIDEFNLPLRLLAALTLSMILYKLFIKTLQIFSRIKPAMRPTQKIFSVLIVALTYLVVTLSIFGGGLNWQTELNFENIGVTKDKFLNEAILDSYQAIYRSYVLQSRIASSAGLNFTAEDIKELAAQHANQPPTSNSLNDYLRHQAKGSMIPKPKHIFVIISESYANWPLLDKYTELHIADGMKSIISAENSDYCPTFLPNGGSTVSAVTGIVTGLADANLYLTTLPQSFTAPYLTATAPQMKNLGYDTNFFYAGPTTWERIEELSISQGFDKFYGEGDIVSEFRIPNYELRIKNNVWGVDDKFLYNFVEDKLDVSTPSFNVILNTSNHAPYTVDLEAEGITLSKTFDDESLNKKLAHHFYADRELKKFIDTMKLKAPESLFVIVGDHADRCNIDKQPSDYERFGVPLIITGNGIHHELLNKKSAGSQIDIIPTIIELIAPKDFEYYSIGKSLTENTHGVNYALFITRTALGNANAFPLKPEPLSADVAIESEDWSTLENYINYVRGVSYWLAKFGKELQPNDN